MIMMKTSTSVGELMTKELLTVAPDTCIKEVEEIFNKNNFHHLPVIDKRGALLGLFSKEDLLCTSRNLNMVTSGKTFSDKIFERLEVGDVMTKNPMSLEPDDTVGLAADIFKANQFHALPIVDGTELLGILTTYDIIDYCFSLNDTEPY